MRKMSENIKVQKYFGPRLDDENCGKGRPSRTQGNLSSGRGGFISVSVTSSLGEEGGGLARWGERKAEQEREKKVFCLLRVHALTKFSRSGFPRKFIYILAA